MKTDNQKLIDAILSGEITEEQARIFLSESTTPKRKRGRPKKIITSTKKRVGRPKDELSAETKVKVMMLWVALERTTKVPKMLRRNLIATCVNKSVSFVDKALVTLTKYKKLGWVYVANEAPFVLFASPKDVDNMLFAEKLGLDTSAPFKKIVTVDTATIHELIE